MRNVALPTNWNKFTVSTEIYKINLLTYLLTTYLLTK